MFASLQITTKKRLFYRPNRSVSRYGDTVYTELLAPRPRTDKQWRILNQFLLPYAGRLVLPKGFADPKLCVAPIDTRPFCDRVLLCAFLRFCKEQHPACAVLRPAGKLHPDFYFAISPFVGRLVLLETVTDPALRHRILAHSGTPLFFDRSIVEGAVLLDLSDRSTPKAGIYSTVFSAALFDRIDPPAMPFKEPFPDCDPLMLSAALDQTKHHPDLLNAWVEVMNQYLFYSACRRF